MIIVILKIKIRKKYKKLKTLIWIRSNFLNQLRIRSKLKIKNQKLKILRIFSLQIIIFLIFNKMLIIMKITGDLTRSHKYSKQFKKIIMNLLIYLTWLILEPQIIKVSFNKKKWNLIRPIIYWTTYNSKRTNLNNQLLIKRTCSFRLYFLNLKTNNLN